MSITIHAYRGEDDLPRLLDLINAMPLACRHVIDLPWRVSSPAICEGRDAAYWQDDEGQVVGFAAWQYYWAALDFFIRPGLPDPTRESVEAALFAWAEQRFRERDAKRGSPLPYAVEYRDDDLERRRLVEAHGFTLDDDEDGYVGFEHPLRDLAPVPALPAGFALRPLDGEREAAAYAELHRAAFQSDSMTTEWRARTIRAPQHRADLDLVIAANDGSLAAFCVGWYAPTRRVAQIEPMGVHPRYTRLGLGRVLLLELLRRFRAVGAESAIVQTNLGRAPARAAYQSVGFQEAHRIRRLKKWADTASTMPAETP
ncbi:MAG TPA: GNAT family N-acetyltransferase [Ktedonobacterales bacterium]|nr:GNAT family N-acetyltransferase [Ktedonobacterales bacterium]